MSISHDARYLWYCPSKNPGFHTRPYAVDEYTLRKPLRYCTCGAQLVKRRCECAECKSGVVLSATERRARLEAILATIGTPNDWNRDGELSQL